MNIKVTSDHGMICLWDRAQAFPSSELERPALESVLRREAKAGKVFFIDTEDPMSYRIRVLVNEEPDEELAASYPASSGSFRLEAPSGELTLAGVQELLQGAQPEEARISVAPGTYLVSVLSHAEFDGEMHARKMTELLGEQEWRYRQAVDKIGAFGCLGLVLAAICLAIPFLRRYWLIFLPILLAPMLLHLLLSRLPRYRAGERESTAYHEARPHGIFILRRTDAAKELEGGWVDRLD